MDKSISINFPTIDLTSDDRIIVFEKLLVLLTTKKGTHFEDPNFFSPLHSYVNVALTNEIMQDMHLEISTTIATHLPNYAENIGVDIRPLDDMKGFIIRLYYFDNFIELSSELDYFA